MSEGYANPTVLNGSAGNSAPVGGRRRSGKKLRLVKKKTVRRMLKKMGMKMRGGGPDPVVTSEPAASAPAKMTAGRRRHRKTKSKGLFGL